MGCLMLPTVFFDVMPILFVVMFVLIAAAIVGTLVKGAAQFHRDNQSPRLSVAAVLVAKRQDFHRGAGDQSVGYTDYFFNPLRWKAATDGAGGQRGGIRPADRGR